MIVVGSLLDLGLEGVDGISVMRGMRLVSGVTARRIRRREKLFPELKGYETFMYVHRASFLLPVQPTQEKAAVDLLHHFL